MIVDPNGLTTNLAYDSRQHLISSTVVLSSKSKKGPVTQVTSNGYDPAGNLVSVTLPDGAGWTYSYDTAHRRTGITDALGQKISYSLDALGDLTNIEILNASNAVTSQHASNFDALGRMTEDVGAANQTSSLGYDAEGNMVTTGDQLSNPTQRAFDALSRVYQITDPANGIKSTSYDAHSRPLNVTAPTGGTTSYVYDGFGDLIQESNPNTGTTVYYYDSTGNQIKRVASTGAITQFTYDALDRVLTKTFPSDTAENVSYTYDQSGHGYGIGRLTSVIDQAGTLSRTYDQLGNLITNVRTTPGAPALTTTYTYDAANRIASITYPSGTLVNYSRDAMGRVTSLTAQPKGGITTPVVSKIAYEPFGPTTGFTFGNSVTEARAFDEDYRLTHIADVGTSTVQDLTYSYYPTNSVQTITDAVTPGNSQSFSYDNLQRLSQATGGYGSFGFTYDLDGKSIKPNRGFDGHELQLRKQHRFAADA